MNFRYTWEDAEKEEYLLIFSGKGNEKYWEEYKSKNNVSKYVVSDSIISAHWFKPIKNEQNETIGTYLFFFNCTEIGSSAPAWL